jgi:hypothetical protein
MKKISPRFILVASIPFLLFSCGVDDEELRNEELNNKIYNAFIYDSDLVGTWNLGSMITDREVDLNNDGVSTKNLLLETKCYDKMSITFRGDRTFSSVNARMDFKGGESNDGFICMGDRVDSGKWSVVEDKVTFYVIINNVEYAEEKQLVLKDDKFSFEVNRAESKAYVSDPGNTSVSKISVVALEYNMVK